MPWVRCAFGNFFFSNCSALNEILRLVTRDGPTHQDRGKLIQPRPRTLTQTCSPPPPSPPLLPQIGRNWLRRPRPGWDWSKLCLGGDGPLACLPFILLCFCAWDILAVEWEAGCQEVGCQSVLPQVGQVDQVDQVGQGGRQEPVPHGCNSSLVSHTWWLNLHMHDKEEKHGLAIILCLWWDDNDQETVKWLIKSQNN